MGKSLTRGVWAEKVLLKKLKNKMWLTIDGEINGQMDRQTDEPTLRGGESHSTRVGKSNTFRAAFLRLGQECFGSGEL